MTPTHLYCADDGEPIDAAEVKALALSSQYRKPHASKSGESGNGRCKLGFKFTHGVAHAPAFFSHPGSFRLDRCGSVKETSYFPPEAIHPIREAALDPVLRDLMEWATNIVRLPLNPAQRDAVAKQIENFPANFPPLGDRAGRLILQTDNMKAPRVIAIPQTNRG